MFGSFCFALLCCFFYKAGEYLCSTSSLQLKYLSAQFGHLKSSTKISMFARLSHRSNISIWNVLSNLEPRKSENCALSTTWSAASALLCSTALKQSLQDAMFFCSAVSRHLTITACPVRCLSCSNTQQSRSYLACLCGTKQSEVVPSILRMFNAAPQPQIYISDPRWEYFSSAILKHLKFETRHAFSSFALLS